MRLSECVRGALDGQSVGSVPVGVFLRRNKNRHGSRVGRIRTHPERICRVCFVFCLTIDSLGARVCVSVCVGGCVSVDVSKAVSSNEASRHTNIVRKETLNLGRVLLSVSMLERWLLLCRSWLLHRSSVVGVLRSKTWGRSRFQWCAVCDIKNINVWGGGRFLEHVAVFLVRILFRVTLVLVWGDPRSVVLYSFAKTVHANIFAFWGKHLYEGQDTLRRLASFVADASQPNETASTVPQRPRNKSRSPTAAKKNTKSKSRSPSRRNRSETHRGRSGSTRSKRRTFRLKRRSLGDSRRAPPKKKA